MAKATFFLAFWAILTLVQSECDQSLCVAGCGSFDARLNSCNFDHQIYSSYENCVCAGFGSPRANENNLINCLSCGTDTPGANSYTTYRSWAVVCGEYELAGEAAAISIDSAPAASASAFFSTQVLPVIQSICPQAGSQSQQTTFSSSDSQAPRTSSLYTGNGPSSTTSPLASTQGGATSLSTQQTSQPTVTSAAAAAMTAPSYHALIVLPAFAFCVELTCGVI